MAPTDEQTRTIVVPRAQACSSCAGIAVVFVLASLESGILFAILSSSGCGSDGVLGPSEVLGISALEARGLRSFRRDVGAGRTLRVFGLFARWSGCAVCVVRGGALTGSAPVRVGEAASDVPGVGAAFGVDIGVAVVGVVRSGACACKFVVPSVFAGPPALQSSTVGLVPNAVRAGGLVRGAAGASRRICGVEVEIKSCGSGGGGGGACGGRMTGASGSAFGCNSGRIG